MQRGVATLHVDLGAEERDVAHVPARPVPVLAQPDRERPDAEVASFRFKAVRPTFDLHPFSVNGQPQADGKSVRLWAADHEGWLTMDATATLR